MTSRAEAELESLYGYVVRLATSLLRKNVWISQVEDERPWLHFSYQLTSRATNYQSPLQQDNSTVHTTDVADGTR